MKTEPFSFPDLPPDEISPRPGVGDWQQLLKQDIAIVRWFIQRWAQRPVDPKSSLGHLLEISSQVDLNAECPSVDSLDPVNAHHALHLTVGLVRLAWAIRALHGRGGRVGRVDTTFVSKELLGEDSTEKSVERTLPGGIGTVVVAARLLQAGGGTIASINGNGVKGHDIHWVTSRGDTVFIERKDRSYEAGLDDTMEKRARRVVAEVRNAAQTMPTEPPTAARVLVVGFAHLVTENELAQVDGHYQRALTDAFGQGATRLEGAPHLVLIEHLGFEPKAGGVKSNFFSPQPLRHSHRFLNRVAPFIVKALDVRDL